MGGEREDFVRYGRMVAAGREQWGKCAHHSLGSIVRYLQFVWPLAECPDAALLPLLGFMAAQLQSEWAWARTWNEAMLGTSGHNWWLCEFGMGFWSAGLLFPEFTGFAQFQAFFPTCFERELQVLMAGDGFTRETSVSYHSGTIDAFLAVARLAEVNDLRFSPEFYRQLRTCYEVEWKLYCPDGGHPPFGDCWSMGDYYRDRLRSVAALLGIPQAKYLAETLYADWQSPCEGMLVESLHYPSVGEDLWPAYARAEARSPTLPDSCLPDSGYYVMRNNWSAEADYAAIEASARGNLVTSHGHGAIFSLILYSRGRAMLVGNGKGPDGVMDPERSWRVSSQSHSVAIADGEDHLPLRSVYRFANVVLPTIDAWISTPDYAYFSGAHEAYERLAQKVPGSRRKLFYLRGHYWLLIDRFTANSPEEAHSYQQRFQLGVPAHLTGEGRAVTEGEGGNLLFVPLTGGTADLSPNPYPLEGYANPAQLPSRNRPSVTACS